MADEVPEGWFMSPGAALAQQAYWEEQADRVLLAQLTKYLAAVEREALSVGLYLSPAFVADTWTRFVGPDALAEFVGRPAAQYIWEGLALSSIPDEAYTSAMSVLTRSVEQAWSKSELAEAMSFALNGEDGTTTMTAAGVVKVDPSTGEAEYDRRFKLALGGPSWFSKMRTAARTAITGLEGLLAEEAIFRGGIPFKRWVTRRDDRVREPHAAVDGHTVAQGRPFYVDGYPMQYPGDRSAPAYLTVNCRCVMIGRGKTMNVKKRLRKALIRIDEGDLGRAGGNG